MPRRAVTRILLGQWSVIALRQRFYAPDCAKARSGIQCSAALRPRCRRVQSQAGESVYEKDCSMKIDFERRRAGRKTILVALGLAVCANGCAYFAEQPEVYPDKFAPAISDRAWTPRPAVAAEVVNSMPARTGRYAP